MNSTGYSTGYIPVEPLATIVESYLATQKEDNTPTGGARGMLCIRSKVNPRRLHDLVNRKSKWIDFSNADKLLCAINKTDYLLFHPELSEQYFKVNLKVTPRAKDWEAVVETRDCLRCGKPFDTYVNMGGHGGIRSYCSQSCSSKVSADNRWEEADAA